ncbi:hypothetical protein [Rhodoblastus sp.]|uniref:hypothetical protein n=1 Tax=Rhodoblastus sp. TaxID=1962975 RepID=UPI003F94B7E0
MFTIYLGYEFVSPRDARFSHLSPQAREAAYFEQFKPENLREIRLLPMLTILAGVSMGFVVLCAFASWPR